MHYGQYNYKTIRATRYAKRILYTINYTLYTITRDTINYIKRTLHSTLKEYSIPYERKYYNKM